MAQIGITIVKRTAFRDSTQEFSNTYHYGSVAPLPSETRALALIDELVAIEKTCHSNAVTFVRASLWSSGGTPAQNQMIAQKLLTGVGGGAANANVDKERAVLVQWSAGVDNRGRGVRLRKWFHVCGNMGAVAFTGGLLDNTTGFTTAQRTDIKNLVQPLTRIGAGIEEYGLVAESGRERTGDGNPVAHKYFEHHQLGDQWRG